MNHYLACASKKKTAHSSYYPRGTAYHTYCRDRCGFRVADRSRLFAYFAYVALSLSLSPFGLGGFSTRWRLERGSSLLQKRTVALHSPATIPRMYKRQRGRVIKSSPAIFSECCAQLVVVVVCTRNATEHSCKYTLACIGRRRENGHEIRGRWRRGVSTYSRIRRRGVTLFHESADRIALIARRVKLPRSLLIERSARVRPPACLPACLAACMAACLPACLPVGQNRARSVTRMRASGVFSSLRAILGRILRLVLRAD